MVADLVPKCSLAADVGTDHGYLPIYLINKGICEKVIGADVNEGPLAAARKNVALTRVKDKIELILSDGLEKIEKADCVTVSGMGGELIASILEKRKDGMKAFVLQPQRSYDFLRKYLAKEGFEIKREKVCREGDKMYCAFYCEYTGERYEISEKDALLGKYSLLEDKAEYSKYVAYRKRQVEIALEALIKNGIEGERRAELEHILNLYKEAEDEIRENN